MVDVGYATLGIIPSMKGLRAELEKQTRGDLAIAGRSAGKTYGDAAGKTAATGFSSSMKSGMRGLALPIGGVLAGLGGVRIFRDIIAESEEAAKVSKITAKLIESTGGAANLSAVQVGNLADSLSKYAAVDDELVQSAQNVLLTFRNVRNELGAGNDIFSRATKGALDLSTVLKVDLNGATLQLGKALQDPVKGMLALTRAGVQFTASQREQVKGYVASNDLLSAQKVILDEVEKQVGGAAGANATALDRLSVSFKNLEEAAGTAAAPALNKLAVITTENVIPALHAAGGVVGDAAGAFGELPGPVKTATAALVAFKLAQTAGLTSSAASGFSSLSNGLDSLRLRAMLAADSYNQLRAGQVQVVNGSGTFTPAVGRMASALGALQTASAGAGTGLKRGLSGALSLIGGPWGAALAVGTLAVASFWREHQKAKQRVEDFTATLDKQTGALTESSREFAAKMLLDAGVLENANALGISLSTVTDAALDEAGALQTLNAELDAITNSKSTSGWTGAFNEQDVQKALELKGAVNDTNGVVQLSITQQKLLAAAVGDSGADARTAAGQIDGYASTMKEARDAVQKLLDVENERRNANRSAFGDRTALAQALSDARVEAAEGAKTLDLNTQAGRDNRNALADLADQWSNSADSVKNSKGAYEAFRQEFIKIATEMTGSGDEAKRLADLLLGIPKNTPAAVNTPGMDKALADARRLKALLLEIRTMFRPIVAAQGAKNRGDIQATQPNGGAPAPRASTGADGTAPNTRTTNNGPAIYVENQYVQPQSYDQFLADQNNRARRAALDGIQR